MQNKRLIQALKKENHGRPPVWLMRQAGRYLPEYRKLREKYSLKELFFNPELAAEITHMPIKRFGVDAAILFSDITVVAEALGLHLEFKEGPIVSPWEEKELSFLPEKLDPIIDAVRFIKEDLTVPLIGFCGGPFTVASYLIGDLEKTLKYKNLPLLLDKIADVSIDYLKRQVKAGADAIQVFDSWANVLSKEQFQLYTLPYLNRFKEEVNAPFIFFMRGAAVHLEEIPTAVSIDWECSLSSARARTNQPLQGNLDPDIFFEPLDVVKKKTKEILASMHEDPAFILNLGHGVKPGTPVDAVRCFVETAKEI